MSKELEERVSATTLKPVVEKVLASGLVDKNTAKLMEIWGYLPDGASDKVKEDKLKNATKEQVQMFVKRLLHIEKAELTLDTSDALALALGHAHMMKLKLM